MPEPTGMSVMVALRAESMLARGGGGGNAGWLGHRPEGLRLSPRDWWVPNWPGQKCFAYLLRDPGSPPPALLQKDTGLCQGAFHSHTLCHPGAHTEPAGSQARTQALGGRRSAVWSGAASQCPGQRRACGMHPVKVWWVNE